MRNRVKPRAVRWVMRHEECRTWSDDQLAQHLKSLKIYSKKTYIKDIRIKRIRLEAAQKVADRRDLQDR